MAVRLPWPSDDLLAPRHEASPWRRVWFGFLAVGTTVVVGTAGYVVIGLNWFDALYQAVITITTVGYTEVGDVEIDRTYRLWTIGQVMFGTGAALFTVSMVVEAVIEDNLNDRIRRRQMQNKIEDLDNHVVIAGWGRVGRAIGAFVRRMGREVVVVDADEDLVTPGFWRVVGQATEDKVLVEAGIERAHSLIAALPSDPDNLYVTLSARSLCPDLNIVARASQPSSEAKFQQAGADRIVSPHKIGGSRMGAVAMQPNVAEFFDEVLHDDLHDVAVLEFVIRPNSKVVGEGVGNLSKPGDTRALVVAIRPANSVEYIPNPDPSVMLGVGDVIIAVGTESQLRALGDRIGDMSTTAKLQLGVRDDTK